MERPRIVSDPSVMMGKPVVAGTRIPVELILEKLAAGESVEQILSAHPRLTWEGISAALGYAARALRRAPDDRPLKPPSTEPHYSLDELLAELTPETLHSELDWGAPVGREVW